MAKKTIDSKIQRRYLMVALCFGIVVIAILGRAFYTSFVEGDSWRKKGEELERRNVTVAATRGNIYASDGELMATTEYRYRLYLDFWAEGVNGDTLLHYIDPLSKELSRMFPQKSAGAYKQHIMNYWYTKEKEEKAAKAAKRAPKQNREFRLLTHDINYLEWKEVQTLPFFKKGSNRSGLYKRNFVKRTKPYGSLASRTIGDIYSEYGKGGKNGLEMQYDSLLKGVPGTSTRKKVNGRFINVVDVKPENGKDIISTIDIAIQDITEKALLKKLQEVDAQSGTAVVMEVSTGQVKAITNMGRIGEGRYGETMNHAVADQIEPGSTFKVLSMMVALEDGVIHPDDSVDVGNGVYMYKGARMTDHNINKGGYGLITAKDAIKYSSNIGVAKLILKGYEDNPSKFVDGIYKIGIQKDLELEIPGAGRARIRSPKDQGGNYWSKTTLPWMSFGYETQIPPIYTLTFFNAIANDGKMVRPYFVKEIRDDHHTIEKMGTRVVNSQICSPNTLKAIQCMLDSVVNAPDGTGKPARSEHVRIAGKTGTAQIAQGAAGYKGAGLSHQVSFCGYFPANNPKYSCIVVIRYPRIGYPSGGVMSGGVFKQIAEEVYSRSIPLKVKYCEEDTISSKSPQVKAGINNLTEYALSKLNIPYESQSKNDWVKAEIQDNEIQLTERKIIDNLVPNVSGMGAKDAVYLLEKAGLRVSVSGRGTVFSQSITAGAHVNKGQTIHIQLK